MILNKTRMHRIIGPTKICHNIFCKATGLMFRKRPDYGLIFVFSRERKIALTMFFVFYEIDVLFLNSRKEVVDIKKNFRPFTNYTSKSPCKYVIELPVGFASRTKTGDIVEFNELAS